MTLPLEKCLADTGHIPLSQLKEILQFPHPVAIAMIDLQLLAGELDTRGEERAAAETLSEMEKVRFDTLASGKRRREWLGGRFAAKHAAAELLALLTPHEQPAWSDFHIAADENGRPFLSGPRSSVFPGKKPDISISHSGPMAVAMAVAGALCGIDIQQVTAQVLKVKDRFCTPNEEQLLLENYWGEQETPSRYLTRLWAAKEAMRKAAQLPSLPGFLEMTLVEIQPGSKLANPFCMFAFNWEKPGFNRTKRYTVAVTSRNDYALAITLQEDARG